jgi:PhnB protein
VQIQNSDGFNNHLILKKEKKIVPQLNPYLRFNGNCREAMTFYQSCFGGELNIQTVGETPAAGRMPAALQDRVMHSVLASGGFMLMASDMTGPEGVKNGDAISLAVIGSSKAELEPIFAKLSAGGNVLRPLTEEYFGTYGDLLDKFGTGWMFQAGGNMNA